MRTLHDVTQQLSLNPEVGLDAASVAASRQQFGENRLTPLPREPLWKKFLEKFDEPIIKVLLAAALLSMVVDLFEFAPALAGAAVAFIVAGSALFAARLPRWLPTFLFASALVLLVLGLSQGHWLIEGLAVMIAVFLATGVAFASEYKSDREFEVLNVQKDSMQAKVLREGQVRSVPLEDVVVGDVIVLEMGDEIPADGRVRHATELMVDQSLMTGESEPVRKLARSAEDGADGPEQPGCLYRGTQVVDGVGGMVVTEVGDATYLGQIARKLSADDEEEDADAQGKRVKDKLTVSKELTPLQLKLTHLAELISRAGYVAAILIFLAQLVRGVWQGEVHWPADGAETREVLRHLLRYFVTMVIIIVVAVPEGLPMSVTVSLALAMRKMTRANSLVRQLVACETIGSATVICSDKTGTLTQNKMQVDRLSVDGLTVDRGQPGWPDLNARTPGSPLDWLVRIAAQNSTANLEVREGRTVTLGNTTEGSLLQWLAEPGIDYRALRAQSPELYQVHFSSERKRMTTVVRHDGSLATLVKGAPEWLLERCERIHAASGEIRELAAEQRQAILAQLRAAGSLAMRTLAFAYAPLPAGTPDDEESLHQRRDELERGLVFVGFVAIRDPLRPEVKDAIAECRRAGIEVKMITGDNVETARAIAYEIGLVPAPDAPIDDLAGSVFTSQKYNELTDEQLTEVLPRLRVLARARPLDKYRMVRLLQDRGEVVAVTGDGTNDAPALKKADVGLAMGIAGTEVAKEASKIVLLDDSFATIVKAVQWGRSLYENIQRFIQFQLTINFSALLTTFLGILIFQVRAPFTVLQLLWINVIMDTFASIALCSEPPRPGVMEAPPKQRDESIVTPAMLRTIGVTGAYFIVVMLGLLVAMRNGFLRGEEPLPDGKDFTYYQATIFFSVYVFFQVWNQINCRSLTPQVSGFYKILENPTFLAIAAAVAVGQVLIVTFGGRVFDVTPLSWLDWLGVIAFTSTVLLFAEVSRRVRMSTAQPQAPAQEATVDTRQERGQLVGRISNPA